MKTCKHCKEKFEGYPTQELCDSCIQTQVYIAESNYEDPFGR